MRRYELTDQQWDLIADLFPEQIAGRPRRSDRQMLNGIFWQLCSGAAWRDLPAIGHDRRYGPWQTVYSRFRGWEADGMLDRILRRLQVELDERGLIDYATWMVDSTSVRASRAAVGAPNIETSKKGILSTHRITPLGAPEAD